MEKSTASPSPGIARWLSHAGFWTAVLLAATAAAYAPVLRAGFVNFDDIQYVTGNPAVQGGLSRRGLVFACTAMQGFWHPITWLSHELDCELYGLRPEGHHATSLLIHLATVAVCQAAWTALTGARWRALAIAAMYALHPLHVESVAWIADRKGLLADLFWMTALWGYARYARTLRPGDYLLTAAAFLAGLASKSTLLPLPAALLILDFWPLARLGPENAARRRALVEKIPLFAAAVGFAVLAWRAQSGFGALEMMTAPPWTVRLSLV